MSRPIRPFALLFAIGFAACSAQLPSERPLGIGPLARQPPPREPSGAPVTMPSGAQTMQFESDEDDDGDDGDDDSSGEKAQRPAPRETPDAGVTSLSDAGPAPSATAPTSTAPATLDFTGDYSGKDVTTIRIGAVKDKPQEDPAAKLSVKKTGDTVYLTIVASNTGDPLCTVKGTQKGDTVTLASGQECEESNSPFAKGKVTRGQVKLQGKQLTLDMTLEVNLNLGGRQLTGGIDYHFEGTRRSP